jgi:hypothetical protein
LLPPHFTQITLRRALVKSVSRRVTDTWRISMTHQQNVLAIRQIL